MARAKSHRRSGRLFRSPSGQDELFEKSYEEEVEAQHKQPIECLGKEFISDEARRDHFLGRLRRGLDELHAGLGGVSFTSINNAVN